MAFVIRDNKILMEKIYYDNRYFYTIPGGGIEENETPEEAAIRELKEECGLDGTIVKKVAVSYGRGDGSEEHVYEVDGMFVQEVKDYTAIGEGEPYALTALYLDHDVVEAVQAACKFSCFVSEPIVSFEVDI